MGYPAGRLDRRVTLQRRVTSADAAGRPRAAYAPVAGMVQVPAGWRELRLAEAVLGNGEQGIIDGEIALRDCTAARGIVSADRLVLDGVGFDVVSAGLPGDDRIIRIRVRKVVG